jgi:hypothetical protein
MIMRRLLLVLTFILFAPGHAIASGDDRVSAVTDFLLKRAEENALYMFEMRLKRNQELACAFPVTYSYIEDGNLRLLLKNKELWKKSVEQDLLTMVSGYAGDKISKGFEFLDFANRYIVTTQYLGLEYQGEIYPLNMVPLSANAEFRKLNYGFYDGVIELDEAIRSLKAIQERTNLTRSGCDIPAMSLEDINQLSESIKLATKHLKAWENHIKINGKLLKLNTEKIKEECQAEPNHYHCKFINKPPQEWLQSEVEKAVGATAIAVATGVALKNFTDKIKATNTYAAKVLVAEKFMKQTGLSKSISNPERLTNDLMFFAELADADSNGGKAEVEEILMRYTLPPVTFGVKRETQTHVMITGYLTASFGNVINSSEVSSNNRLGIYAPVGVEVSHALESGSISLMIAPFDFGYPISLKLNGVEQGVKLDEVVAPSIALSYGLKDYPLSVGVAYQRGRRSSLTNAVEKRAMIFMGIDMPLFLFY